MNKKPLIIAIIVIAVLAIGYFVVWPMVKPSTETAEQETSEEQSKEQAEKPAEKNTSTEPLVENAVVQPDKLKVESSNLVTRRDGSRVVSGTIKNVSDRIFAPVEAQVILKDEAGKTIEVKSTAVTLIEPGFSWEFEVPVADKSVAKFEVKVLAPEQTGSEWEIKK